MALGFDPHHDPDDLLTDVSERPSRLQRLLDASVPVAFPALAFAALAAP